MIRTAFALAALLVAQAGTPGVPYPEPVPSPTPDVPVYVGNVATHFNVESRPLGIDPDGRATWLLIAHFYDGQNKPTTILANSDLDWVADRGHVQWQSRMRFGSPAAIVTTDRDGIINAKITANMPHFGSVRISTNTQTWKTPRAVAQALGPYMVQVGWFPRAIAPVRVQRVDLVTHRTVTVLLAGGSTYRDTTAQPSHRYRYTVTPDPFCFQKELVKAKPGTTGRNRTRPCHPDLFETVGTPPALRATDISMASGKGMWLYWSLNPTDDNYYAKLDPAKIADQAARAGLHYVEVRTAYGAHWQVPPAAKPTIDAIIDDLAARGILTMAWSVPREATFEDISASARSAQYRTAKGTSVHGIAVDLERGDEFLGADPLGLPALWIYEKYLREALGPNSLIVATVEDPSFEHLDESKYPFREIARYADVLQPMAYWRMMRRTPTTPEMVTQLMQKSVTMLLAVSGRTLPVSIGGQTGAEGRLGYPPGDEIVASLNGAKAAGAIGVCYFDYDGTQPYQWDALASYRW
ncbi:MAG TPA: hypothetical protein VMS32_04190 [Verrucomicrobiae bacterium]|jgi:hypothetical protein|nr:hypothetical protein [Verrucomicrobiae bacterium]